MTWPKFAGTVLAKPWILNFVPHKLDVTSTSFTSSGNVSTYANSSFGSVESFGFDAGVGRSLEWFGSFDGFTDFRHIRGEFRSRFSISLSLESLWSQFNVDEPPESEELFASNPFSEYWWKMLFAGNIEQKWRKKKYYQISNCINYYYQYVNLLDTCGSNITNSGRIFDVFFPFNNGTKPPKYSRYSV